MKHQKEAKTNRPKTGFSSGFKRGFLEGLSAHANLIMPFSTTPTRPVPVYKSKGLAGDWEKVGGDLRSAMENYSHKK